MRGGPLGERRLLVALGGLARGSGSCMPRLRCRVVPSVGAPSDASQFDAVLISATCVRACGRGCALARRPINRPYSVGSSFSGRGAAAVMAARIPCNSAVGDGGHPGIVTSTGRTFDTAPTVA